MKVLVVVEPLRSEAFIDKKEICNVLNESIIRSNCYLNYVSSYDVNVQKIRYI